MERSLADPLEARIKARDITVGVLGMGYVGLPLALAFVKSEVNVLGFDVDSRKVDSLNAGKSYIDHFATEEVAAARATNRLEATSDFARLAEPDALLICVPTPLTSYRDPDLSYVIHTAEAIREALRPGQLVILESTTYPGTTEELLRELLEESGLVCGEDFFLAYSPEREDPGNPDFSTTTIPKVVGGVGEEASRLAEALYSLVVPKTIRVSSARVAEATKLTENIFRAVNIALVNELKMLYDRMSIDVREVLDAAATKPFGFMRFDPGPGWGGHCIPVDPFYLSWKAKEFGGAARFIELAGTINVEMPRYVINKVQCALNEQSKPLRGSRVLVLGLAYKKDVADPRESPAFEILDLLGGLGAEIAYHDPYVPESPTMRTWPNLPHMSSMELSAENLEAQDVVLLVTDHTKVDYDFVAKHAKLIVDTRGVYRQPLPNVVRA